MSDSLLVGWFLPSVDNTAMFYIFSATWHGGAWRPEEYEHVRDFSFTILMPHQISQYLRENERETCDFLTRTLLHVSQRALLPWRKWPPFQDSRCPHQVPSDSTLEVGHMIKHASPPFVTSHSFYVTLVFAKSKMSQETIRYLLRV